MTKSTNNQKTYTTNEVTELMHLVLHNWDRHLLLNIERLEKDEQSQDWAINHAFEVYEKRLKDQLTTPEAKRGLTSNMLKAIRHHNRNITSGGAV